MAEYIDRGDLTIWLNKKSCEYSMNDVAPIGWTLKGLINELATFPTADVVERKDGKWIEIRRNDVNPLTGKCGVYVGCSECGASLPTDSYLDFIDESDCKFCYNCGAKMIGDTDDV